MDNKPSNPNSLTRSILHSQVQASGFPAGLQLLQAGRLGEAHEIFRQLLAEDPRHYQAYHQLALIEYRVGHADRALEYLRRCLVIKHDYAEGLADLAQILADMGRDADALSACERALAANPHHAPSHRNHGNMLLRLGRLAEARIAYVRAVELDPNFAAAYASLADTLAAEGRLEEALLACDRALMIAPNLAFALGVRGTILHRRGKFAEAAKAYTRALQISPDMGVLYARLANTLRSIGRFDEAIEASKRAIDLDPNSAESYSVLGQSYQALGRNEDALAAYRQAIAIKPRFLDVHTHLGLLLHRTGRCEEAIEAYQTAVAIDPECEFALTNLASIFKEQGRPMEAADAYGRLAATKAGASPGTLYEYCNLRRQVCDWDGLDGAEARALDAVRRSGERVPPFPSLFMQCSAADYLAIARGWARGFAMGARTALGEPPAAPNPDGQLRIGYLSTDFHSLSTAGLAANLIENHDRKRFEVYGYCWAHDDGSDMRQRITGAFDNFVDLRTFSNADAARRIREDGIDILIDLKGYGNDARSMILASRPAPVQVSFLGYPATMGAPFMDYIIADPFVAPMTHQALYDEKIVHLPDCYQPSDSKHKIATGLDRAACGLPEAGFVFCAFATPAKITRPVFSIWMRLLHRVPGAVLWLLETEAHTKKNLLREASAAGIAPSRLIFAPKVPTDEHLARYRLADLLLDTLPVNAHSVAGEALWAGLPMLTCAGDAFAGRIGGSLLKAAGVPELITYSLADYELMAYRLTSEPGMLDAIRGRLERNRSTAALFATDRYTRNIEAAYAYMVLLHAHGRPPEAFAVADLPGTSPLRFTAHA